MFDSHRDPLVQYWDDDCLEIFLDEDYSGGDHQYNHNAFAYHVSLDNQAIDIGTDKLPHSYSHHVQSRWQQRGDKVVWELAIDIYTDDYVDGSTKNAPVKLSAGKVMGLMIAWCDNDGSELRENFMGSESAPGEKKDRGWIDAGLVRFARARRVTGCGSGARRRSGVRSTVEQSPVFFRAERSIRVAFPWLVEGLEEEHGRIRARAPIARPRDSSGPGRLIGALAKLVCDGRPARFENRDGFPGNAARTPSMFSIVYASASSIVFPSHSG